MLLFSEVSDDFFLNSSTTSFKSLHPSFKIYSLFFVFFFLCLCFCFISFFLNKKIRNSRLIIGGAKKGFWGARARAAPQSLRLCVLLCRHTASITGVFTLVNLM